jgi:hypothetical protein
MDGVTFAIFIAVALLAGVVYSVATSRAAEKKRRVELENRFGTVPEDDVELESIAAPWRSGAAASPADDAGQIGEKQLQRPFSISCGCGERPAAPRVALPGDDGGAVLVSACRAVSVSVALVLALGFFCANILTSYLVGKKIEHHAPAVRYFSLVLRCGRELCSVRAEWLEDLQRSIGGALSSLRGLRGAVSGSLRNGFITNDLESFTELGRMLVLQEVRSYNRMLAAIANHAEPCAQLCLSIAELDVAIAVLSFRKSLPWWSRLLRNEVKQMTLNVQDLYHPLLRKAVPNRWRGTCRGRRKVRRSH